jgi:3'-phosphoadenosine 5'-phosphosulfate sulfotransferase (PAPS reductase)/FAD synthetase
MFDPYKIPTPALISFSGGRTSGFMLWNIIQAYNGKLPDDIHVVFANTGKEAPETLDFINEISQKWDIKIHWLEHYFGDERPIHRTKEVTYKTAARNGEPFERLLDQRGYLPNPTSRFCTSELKIKVMQRFMRKIKGYETWHSVIGLRYDEPRRVANSKKANDYERWTNITPMYDAKHTVEDVTAFWNKQNFDLRLTNQNGKTPAGNCDLCFLKGMDTTISIMKERPEMAEWWIKQEQKFGNHDGAKFRKDRPKYIDLVDISKKTQDLFNDDDQMTCFCHD